MHAIPLGWLLFVLLIGALPLAVAVEVLFIQRMEWLGRSLFALQARNFRSKS
jgi:hypothetical protein